MTVFGICIIDAPTELPSKTPSIAAINIETTTSTEWPLETNDKNSNESLRKSNQVLVMVVICLSIIIVFLCFCICLGYAWVNKRHPKKDLNNGGVNFVDLHLEKIKSNSAVQNVNNDKTQARKYKTNNIVDLSQPTAGGIKDIGSDGSVLEKNINVIYNTDESNHGEANECSDSNELTGDTSNEDMYAKSDKTEVVTKTVTQEAENSNENVSQLQISEPQQIEGQS